MPDSTLPFLPYTLDTRLLRARLADTPATRRALVEWHSARQTFNRLLALAPSVRQVINELLHDTLGSDPEHTGLRLRQGSQAHFVNLTQLCLFAHHYPTPSADLDARASIEGDNRKITELRPSELYTRLAGHDLPGRLRDRWKAYWGARAQGTASSRLAYAQKQYRAHFLATLEVALIQGTLGTEHQRALLGLLENPEWLIHDNHQVLIELPSSHPGAIIVSLADEPPQVLYDPSQPQAFTGYATREALEVVLATAGHEALSYTSVDSISLGFTPLFEQLESQLLGTLAQQPDGRLEHHAASSLSPAEHLAQSWRNSQVFAQPPADDWAQLTNDSRPSLFDFGNLGLELAPVQRKQLISRQLDLLDALSEDRFAQCKQLQASIADARNTAQVQISTLTSSAKWHSDAKPTAAGESLVQTHRDGLLAHARLQHALGLLDAPQLGWVQSVLDGSGNDAVAAQIELLPPTEDGTDASAVKSILVGAFAITANTGANTSDKPSDVLLYWLGEQGGLLRFEDRQQLETSLNAGMPVALSELAKDAIAHTLDAVLAAGRQEKNAVQEKAGLDAVATALPWLREKLGLSLQVPRHAAREISLSLRDEQQQLIARTNASLGSLAKIPATQRQALLILVNDYLAALRNAQALIARDVPERRIFCQRLVEKRLRRDFDGLNGHAITLDLPASVAHVKDLIVGSGAPGTPTKLVPKPSEERVSLALETLLLDQIDDSMFSRLGFMQLNVTPADETLRQALQSGIDATYLRALAQELDLAQRYESEIIEAFQGIDEPAYSHAFRRECLVEPHRLILRLQNQLFGISGHLDRNGQAMLAQVIDARSKADYHDNGYDLRLLPAMLTSGGPDTDGQPVSLAGITFIEDRTRKTTILYRPDHPSSPLRQFPDLESARLSLFEGSVDSCERDYLANRALKGNPAAHRSRLDQAHAHRFKGIIGIGMQWPATRSLAQLQLDTHMGQLLEAHRSSSRSNLDVHLENLAAQAGKLLIGFKVALGLIPGLGLPVSLYDLYSASVDLVKAIAEQGTADVLEAIQNIFVSILDIGMDLLGGSAAINTAGLRRSVKRHQLGKLRLSRATPMSADNSAQSPLAGLQGYQMTDPVSLAGLSVGKEGRYRGIYRHAQSNYIQVQGRQYQVLWDQTSHTWELAGNASHRFKRAIALDEQGQWDTHLTLYGVHRLGGGVGGGQVLGQLADTLDPLWPAPIKERLPRWWRDQAYRRHNRLRDSLHRDLPELQARSAAINQRMHRSFALQDAHDASLSNALQTCIEDAKRLHADCLAFTEVSSGRLRHDAQAQANDLAMLICDSHNRLSQMAQRRINEALDDITRLRQQARDNAHKIVPGMDAQRVLALSHKALALRSSLYSTRSTALTELDELRRQVQAMRTWRRQINQISAHREAFQHIDSELAKLTDPVLDYMDIGQLLGLLTRTPENLDGTWINLQYLMRDPRAELDRTLYALHQLANTRASMRQRKAILDRSIEQIRQFKNRLRYWKTSYSRYFDQSSLERFSSTLDAHERHARTLQPSAPATRPSVRAGRQQPRVFETSQQHYLIGEPDQQQPNTYRITGVNGRTEIYRQDASGKFTLTNPDTSDLPTVHRATLTQLRSEATRHLDELDAFTRQVRQYAAQNMAGTSLEDLMLFKVADLDSMATRIAEQAPQDPLLLRLRSASRQLTGQGRTLRIEQIMNTHEPNGGQLDYLVEQDVLAIEKVGSLVELRRTAEGRRDFLQEFVIHDRRQEPPRPLWYAHVHFNKPSPGFDEFVKAHLKTPAQRYLGQEWQASHIERIWRGDLSRPQALKHLAGHF
ncbi:MULTISPECIES: DUF6543 domain-containing protein [unclassified Pseudomonas]|uniref:dermonecrotic toxin domain-containing protein n=1 Tax=unclassified Pseudomonas TaxID=196821 RepID=UPI0020982450|nr:MULTISPECIES: DUF6543 domain-containing protein [unclassified Pseudomonas]MCO7521183.1 hypothetical protein [Pseudomonas sp. 1]MCO7540937.1 hypothetical protein [Pseudomonas sp. VA159-2]